MSQKKEKKKKKKISMSQDVPGMELSLPYIVVNVLRGRLKELLDIQNANVFRLS